MGTIRRTKTIMRRAYVPGTRAEGFLFSTIRDQAKPDRPLASAGTTKSPKIRNPSPRMPILKEGGATIAKNWQNPKMTTMTPKSIRAFASLSFLYGVINCSLFNFRKSAQDFFSLMIIAEGKNATGRFWPISEVRAH